MVEVILVGRADADVQAAFNRLDDYQSGRGEVFIQQLDLALEFLRQNPEAAPVYAGPYRRMLLRNFPYGIFYQVQPRRVVVVAVLNLRQDPKRIRERLFGRE
jgi:hypothetical protein